MSSMPGFNKCCHFKIRPSYLSSLVIRKVICLEIDKSLVEIALVSRNLLNGTSEFREDKGLEIPVPLWRYSKRTRKGFE